MSLLDKLLEKAAEEVRDPKRHQEWAEKGFDEAIGKARELLADKVTNEDLAYVGQAANFGLDKVVNHRAEFVKLGANGLRATIALLASGRLDDAAQQATLLSIRTSASWDEVTEAITSVAESGNQLRREFEEAKAGVLSVLRDVGIVAAKAILPVLIAVI